MMDTDSDTDSIAAGEMCNREAAGGGWVQGAGEVVSSRIGVAR